MTKIKNAVALLASPAPIGHNNPPKAKGLSKARINGELTAMPEKAFRFGTMGREIAASLEVTGATKEARAAFRQGYVAYHLNQSADKPTVKMLADATDVIECGSFTVKGRAPTKLRKGQSRRSERQEAALTAERKAWSRALILAGLQTDKPKAAKVTASPKPGTTEATDKPASPELKTAKEIECYFALQGAAMLATSNKNAGVQGFKPQWKSAVEDFIAAIKTTSA